VGCLAAGIIAGADSIDDMDLLRHGAMPGPHRARRPGRRVRSAHMSGHVA
jgi:hypothetical protein